MLPNQPLMAGFLSSDAIFCKHHKLLFLIKSKNTNRADLSVPTTMNLKKHNCECCGPGGLPLPSYAALLINATCLLSAGLRSACREFRADSQLHSLDSNVLAVPNTPKLHSNPSTCSIVGRFLGLSKWHIFGAENVFFGLWPVGMQD